MYVVIHVYRPTHTFNLFPLVGFNNVCCASCSQTDSYFQPTKSCWIQQRMSWFMFADGLVLSTYFVLLDSIAYVVGHVHRRTPYFQPTISLVGLRMLWFIFTDGLVLSTKSCWIAYVVVHVYRQTRIFNRLSLVGFNNVCCGSCSQTDSYFQPTTSCWIAFVVVLCQS